MKAGLFIPCYVDQFYPQVGIATLQVLQKLGVNTHVPMKQTCCGQPLANSGMEKETDKICSHFIELFQSCDVIVGPTGSCVLHLKEHIPAPAQTQAYRHISENIYELTEFITDVLNIKELEGSFPHRVGLHHSCHGLRGLRNGKSSELAGSIFSKADQLLRSLEGIELVEPDKPDECCGFGGIFSIFEEAVSARMGKDRIRDHMDKEAEIITATDMSCLMHMEGLIRRDGQPVKIKHVAEIFNEAL